MTTLWQIFWQIFYFIPVILPSLSCQPPNFKTALEQPNLIFIFYLIINRWKILASANRLFTAVIAENCGFRYLPFYGDGQKKVFFCYKQIKLNLKFGNPIFKISCSTAVMIWRLAAKNQLRSGMTTMTRKSIFFL